MIGSYCLNFPPQEHLVYSFVDNVLLELLTTDGNSLMNKNSKILIKSLLPSENKTIFTRYRISISSKRKNTMLAARTLYRDIPSFEFYYINKYPDPDYTSPGYRKKTTDDLIQKEDIETSIIINNNNKI